MTFLSQAEFFRLNASMKVNKLFELAHGMERDLAKEIPVDHLRLEIMRSWLSCFESESDQRLRQLFSLVGKLTPDMSHKHFIGLMVPLERLFNREIVDSDFCVATGDKGTLRTVFPLTVVLDNVRSAINVGSIFRTAECLGVAEIMLCGYTATPEHPKVHKAAMGTAEAIRHQWFAHLEEAVAVLRTNKVSIIAVETCRGADNIGSVTYPQGKLALLFGNEQHGLGVAALSAADHIAKIPMMGNKNSLNIAVAAGIMIHSVIKDTWHTERPIVDK